MAATNMFPQLPPISSLPPISRGAGPYPSSNRGYDDLVPPPLRRFKPAGAGPVGMAIPPPSQIKGDEFSAYDPSFMMQHRSSPPRGRMHYPAPPPPLFAGRPDRDRRLLSPPRFNDGNRTARSASPGGRTGRDMLSPPRFHAQSHSVDNAYLDNRYPPSQYHNRPPMPRPGTSAGPDYNRPPTRQGHSQPPPPMRRMPSSTPLDAIGAYPMSPKPPARREMHGRNFSADRLRDARREQPPLPALDEIHPALRNRYAQNQYAQSPRVSPVTDDGGFNSLRYTTTSDGISIATPSLSGSPSPPISDFSARTPLSTAPHSRNASRPRIESMTSYLSLQDLENMWAKQDFFAHSSIDAPTLSKPLPARPDDTPQGVIELEALSSYSNEEIYLEYLKTANARTTCARTKAETPPSDAVEEWVLLPASRFSPHNKRRDSDGSDDGKRRRPSFTRGRPIMKNIGMGTIREDERSPRF